MTTEKKKELWRAIKFALFSVSAGLIDMGSFALLDLIPGFQYVYKAYISITLSVIWNFTLNRKFTFQSASNVPIAMLKTLGYYVIFAPLSIHLADMYLVKTLGWNEILVKAITMIVNFVTEFLFQRFIVFGKSLDTNEQAKKQAKKEQQGGDLEQSEKPSESETSEQVCGEKPLEVGCDKMPLQDDKADLPPTNE